MQRNIRQKKILELIKEKEIETQQELCEELSAIDVGVTQATVSRDIRELHLYKVKGANKRYHYVASEWEEPQVPDKMLSLFRTCVVKICTVGNTIVVKTLNGNGGNAGAVMDMLNYPEVVGTIAGDDTVFSLCENSEKAKTVHN
ncbi:MAG: arginine repressor, partial [Clostridia bacterium]|nr:arginine repressor [Clostridia bacterium]